MAAIVGISALLVASIVVTNRLYDRTRFDLAGRDSGQDLAGDEQALTREFRDAQAIYLDSVTHRNRVLGQIQSDPEPAWTELRILAAEMKVAEEEQLSKLENGTWPEVSRSAILDLQGEIRLAIPYWQKAAISGNSDEVHTNIRSALVYCGGSPAANARAALRLPPA
ncbi:hypothetical protein Q0Z83_049030 [Actinoplanes sichuanensis]|uniref:Uncharacterized protein n=1 Tax=Actinoplanes sichuanensis TaxID=512349 RepID=A0ABW4AQR7_9ACTN|nr:hypothetical protein [Actinoplanes sichuanensis]BEL06712.1 hypothetical protein Q0Z83_049030 [Actinoplanes sichuanensis]